MRPLAALLVSALLLAGCASQDSEPAAPSPAPEASPSAVDGSAGGPVADLHIECAGEGGPTVVLIAGLDTSGATFGAVQDSMAATSRTCWYDRAGIGDSRILADDAADPSPGSAAADLHASLAAQGVDPPYVVLGWSYGGLVAQAYAAAFPEDLAGLVLEDSSVREQFTDPFLVADLEKQGVTWAEGGREIDTEAVKEQLAGLDLGDLRLTVLSQDDVGGRFRRVWYRYHDELTRRSSDGVHVVAVGAGHAVHEDSPDLVVATLEAVVAAARSGKPLGACDDRFTAPGGRCR